MREFLYSFLIFAIFFSTWRCVEISNTGVGIGDVPYLDNICAVVLRGWSC